MSDADGGGPPTADDVTPAKTPTNARLRDFFHRLFPSLVESSFLTEARGYYEGEDRKERRENVPEPDETSKLECIWAAEFYTPANVESLLDAFERLGWSDEESAPLNRNPSEWLRDMRARGGTGWMNLGTFLPLGSKLSSAFNAKRMVLPPKIERASGQIFAVSSSLTCIVFCFYVYDDAGREYENVMREHVRTKLEARSNGYGVLDPRTLKETRIRELREDLQAQLGRWFAANLPGVFSSRPGITYVPTCEMHFVTDSEEPPVDPQRANLHRSYLGIERGWRSWSCLEVPGLQFDWGLRGEKRGRVSSLLTISAKSLSSLDVKAFGGHTRYAYHGYFGIYLPALVCRWALLELIRHYLAGINRLRDSRDFANKTGNTADIIDNLRQLTTDSVDIASIVPELISTDPDKLWAVRDTWDFKQMDDRLSEDRWQLLRALDENISRAASSLTATENVVRDLLLQQGNLASAAENLALQRSIRRLTSGMAWLTVAAVALSGLTAFAVFFPVEAKVLGDLLHSWWP